MMRTLTLLLALCCTLSLQAQVGSATITGRITDALSDQPIDLVTIYIDGTSTAVESATNGRYAIRVPADTAFTLIFTRIGYRESRVPVRPLPPGSSKQVDVSLAPTESEVEVIVRESEIQEGGMIQETVEELRLLPTTTGNLESILPHIALGVSSGTGGELTSQYQVRGGNYDENLVYVNDFAIYRPQLIRAGQQEGLTFANLDLIQNLSFSSGGFEARYGDKLSSVLDIKYKRPDSLRASIEGSFLGGSAHVEGSFAPNKDSYRRLRYMVGARYKTTAYLLGSLDTEGEYITDFSDLQAYITYDLRRDLQLGILGNYNRAVYEFEPTERNTAFGLINFSLNLFSVFEGREVDDFTTQMGGVSLTFLPEKQRNPLFLKFLASAYRSDENERIDITGSYSLREIDSNLGSSNFGEVLSELGSGDEQDFVRNFLDLQVYNAELKGGLELERNLPDRTQSHFLQWSTQIQHERIDDRINEWERLDSAGYSLPFDTNAVLLNNTLKSTNQLRSYRFSAYFQDTYTRRVAGKSELRISAGVRATYWDLNGEFNLSPRAQLLYKPLNTARDISFRLAGGVYVQPPFYREMRGFDGTVNTDLLAQKSVHVLGGLTYDFYMGRSNPKKFRFITEAYYKRLTDLVSYEIENVRIRYSGQNDAEGYIAGIDFRINGEFVPGAESWINLSFLRARENLIGVQHLRREVGQAEGQEVNDVPRPTDQLFQLSMFFQDYLRSNENFKMNLRFTVGSGLPFGIPENNREFRNTYRFDTYHRVDIGFSILLHDREQSDRPNPFFGFSRKAWLSLEVFNLMQVQNQAGNTWIKTVFNQQYAIPNQLTSRRINLRARLEF